MMENRFSHQPGFILTVYKNQQVPHKTTKVQGGMKGGGTSWRRDACGKEIFWPWASPLERQETTRLLADSPKTPTWKGEIKYGTAPMT